jgi:hypothetical protein
MLAEVNYSEKDAEFDSQLLLREIENVGDCWLGNSINDKNAITMTENHKRSFRLVLEHLRNVRVAKFSREALAAEFNHLQQKDDLEPEALHTNTDFSEHFKTANTIAAIKIPDVERMASKIADVTLTTYSTTNNEAMKQLRKDIERDKILVNGVRFVGAEQGMERILRSMCSISDSIMNECTLRPVPHIANEAMAVSLLSKACRSHSGGIAFQAAHSLIDPSIAMLIPQSAVAPPLRIDYYLGALPRLMSADSHGIGSDTVYGATKWGLVGKVSIESIFKVQLFDAPTINDGYDDCTINDNEPEPDDFAPALFCPVPRHPASAISAVSVFPKDDMYRLAEPTESENSLAVESHAVGGAATGTGAFSETAATGAPESQGRALAHEGLGPRGGVHIGHKLSYVSVVYEDYVTYEVDLCASSSTSPVSPTAAAADAASVSVASTAPTGSKAYDTDAQQLEQQQLDDALVLSRLTNDWKQTACVTVTEVTPVKTLL